MGEAWFPLPAKLSPPSNSYPWFGGAFITVDYFLTSAISGVSGLYYLASLMDDKKTSSVPSVAGFGFLDHLLSDKANLVLVAALVLFLVLLLINLIGVKESASVTSSFATVEIIVTFLLMGFAVFLSGSNPTSAGEGFSTASFIPGSN